MFTDVYNSCENMINEIEKVIIIEFRMNCK